MEKAHGLPAWCSLSLCPACFFRNVIWLVNLQGLFSTASEYAVEKAGTEKKKQRCL